MKTLGVAGCSWMAATQDLDRIDCLANSHFTELLAQELNWDYYTLARGGASNFCISFQVQQLIKEKVDLILVGFTTIDRDDIPINLNRDFTIFDFNYNKFPDLSALDKRFSTNPALLSSSILGIVETANQKRSRDVDEYITNVFKLERNRILDSYSSYFENLYDYNLKLYKDLDTITSTILKLEESKIPYLFYTPFCTSEWLESRKGYIPSTDKAVPWTYPIPETGGFRYHTTAETQKEIKRHWYPYMAKIFPKNFPEVSC